LRRCGRRSPAELGGFLRHGPGVAWRGSSTRQRFRDNNRSFVWSWPTSLPSRPGAVFSCHPAPLGNTAYRPVVFICARMCLMCCCPASRANFSVTYAHVAVHPQEQVGQLTSRLPSFSWRTVMLWITLVIALLLSEKFIHSLDDPRLCECSSCSPWWHPARPCWGADRTPAYVPPTASPGPQRGAGHASRRKARTPPMVTSHFGSSRPCGCPNMAAAHGASASRQCLPEETTR